jgi:hypothetical protein
MLVQCRGHAGGHQSQHAAVVPVEQLVRRLGQIQRHGPALSALSSPSLRSDSDAVFRSLAPPSFLSRLASYIYLYKENTEKALRHAAADPPLRALARLSFGSVVMSIAAVAAILAAILLGRLDGLSARGCIKGKCEHGCMGKMPVPAYGLGWERQQR